MKKNIVKMLIMVTLILFAFPSFQAQAKVHDFSTMYMELNVPDDTILLTKDTPNMDEQWLKIGITDPKTEKEAYDKMGVQAILYDPSTETTVRLLNKQSSESKEIFHFSLLSEDAFTEFLNGLITSTDENAKLTAEKYTVNDTNFFRFNIETTLEGIPFKEIIYGTIVNGSLISFDVYKENSTQAINESYIQTLVSGVHFTKLLDKAEVEKQEREATILSIISLVILILILATWTIILKKKRKKQVVLTKRKSEELTQFYIKQREKEEKNIKDTELFHNRIQYSENVIKTFYYYNEISKHLKLWIISMLLYFIVFVALFISNATLLGYVIIIIPLCLLIFSKKIQIENLVKRTMKNYDTTKSMEMDFLFYEDYFTLSGVQSNYKYAYLQITDIKVHKDYIYIYLGAEKAVYLKKDGFEQGLDNFVKFIRQGADSKLITH